MALANRQTKLAKSTDGEQAVFGLYSMGISTNRDEWVYDFDEKGIAEKSFSFVEPIAAKCNDLIEKQCEFSW